MIRVNRPGNRSVRWIVNQSIIEHLHFVGKVQKLGAYGASCFVFIKNVTNLCTNLIYFYCSDSGIMIKDFTHIFVIMFNGKDTWAQSFQLD